MTYTLKDNMNDSLSEASRTAWIAASAASSFANKTPLSELELEELECLAAVINAELQDRARTSIKAAYMDNLERALSS